MMKLIFLAGFMLSVRAFAADSADTTPPSRPEAIEVISYTDDQINLQWIGSGDDGWDGKASRYLAKWSSTEILDDDQWQSAPDLKLEFTNKTDAKRISAFTVGTKLGDRGFIAIRAQDDAGNLSDLAPSLSFNIINPYTELGSVLTKTQTEALAMGNESDGKVLFGCIAQYEKDLVPGKHGTHLTNCVIARGTLEIHVPTFRLISKSNGYKWLAAAAAVNPVKTGRIGGEDAFTCRSTIEGGLHIGFFVKSLGCNISYGGGVRILGNYELLVK